MISQHAADGFDARVTGMEEIEMLGDTPKFDLAHTELLHHQRHFFQRVVLEAEICSDKLIGGKLS